MCGRDPLTDENTVNTLFAQTSASCDDRMRQEVTNVHSAYTSCQQVWTNISAELEPYETLYDANDQSIVNEDHYSNLKDRLTELNNLWTRRNTAGTAYDAAWKKWRDDDNAAKASCAFADHYTTLKTSISTEFVDKLREEITKMQSLCNDMPTDEPFTISETRYTTHTPTSGRRLLQSSDGVCKDIIDHMQATADNVYQANSDRSTCLLHHCRADKLQLDGTTAVISSKYTTWIRADENFTNAYQAYIVNHDAYVGHLSALIENNKTLDAAKLSLENAKGVVDYSMGVLRNTSECAPSSICCVAPVEIPQICAANAAGNVSVHADAVAFLHSPPPSPPPSPPSPPPSPPSPSPPPDPNPPFEMRLNGNPDSGRPYSLDGSRYNSHGSQYWAGRIEVRQGSGPWKTVCDDGFGHNEALVACRMMGLPTNFVYAKPRAYFGGGFSLTIGLAEVECSGTESNFNQCGWRGKPSVVASSCAHVEDVSVVCSWYPMNIDQING